MVWVALSPRAVDLIIGSQTNQKNLILLLTARFFLASK